jgi:hypothetical protein
VIVTENGYSVFEREPPEHFPHDEVGLGQMKIGNLTSVLCPRMVAKKPREAGSRGHKKTVLGS